MLLLHLSAAPRGAAWRGMPSPLPPLRPSPPRSPVLRAALPADDEYLSDLEDDLQRLAAPRSLFDFGGRRNSIAGQLQRREAEQKRARQRLALRQQLPSRARPPLTRESTQLRNLPATLRSIYTHYLTSPGQPFLLGSLAILIGFYLAGSLSTIFGAKGFWEPVIALGPLLVSERVTREYYTRSSAERSQTLKLFNAMKNGFYLGVVIDALKLAG
ncbi:hypothetical protein AB1Y20_000915 [Prymnesium parvum]|uniref:Uncharacterized protein n=1 Tax=Prymnesium parvum TaxID=97485 RepID=A0AB34KBT7_PRYPA